MAIAASAHAEDQASSAASESSAGSLEEVVVTAEKRAESLQKVPIAITALTQEQIQDRGVVDLTDISQFTPGLSLTQGSGVNGGSTSAQIFIRGIGQLNSQPTADPAVGIYVDGVYLGRAVGSVLDVGDVDRVEVLKGPQGTLYGKNTLAGAINVISKQPSNVYEGYVGEEAGSYQTEILRGALNVPLTPDLSARVSLSYRYHEGFDNDLQTGDKLGSLNQLGAHLVMKWAPTDTVTVKFMADGTSEHDSAQAVHPLAINTTPATTVGKYDATVPPSLQYGNSYITGNRDIYSSFVTPIWTAKPTDDLQLWGGAVQVDADLVSWATLTSVTGYRWEKSHIGASLSGSPIPIGINEEWDSESQISQELRLAGRLANDRITWLVGAYTERELIGDNIRVYIIPTPGAQVIAPDQTTTLTTNSWAAFTQESVKITDDIKLTAGFRHSVDYKDTYVYQYSLYYDKYSIAPGTNQQGGWASNTPKISLDYTPADNVLLYTSFGKGFKSGGTTWLLILPTDFKNYQPEKSTAYEAGVKLDLFGRRLRIDSAISRTLWQDLQFQTNLRPGQLGCATNVPFCSTTINASDDKIDSIENEITGVVTDKLRVFANLDYTHDQFYNLNPVFVSQNIISSVTQLPHSPKWAIAFGADYHQPVSADWVLMLNADYSYKTNQQLNFTPGNDPYNAQKAFGIANARVALENDNLTFELKAQNIGNVLYRVNGNSTYVSTGVDYVTYGPPRIVTLGVRYNF